jgi:hypothetical protein
VSVPEVGGPISSYEVENVPGGLDGAIWGAGNAPAVDAAGNLLVSTGNGSGPTFGLQESVLKLDLAMNLLDSWTPSNWPSLDSGDTDLGSSEPLLLPGGLVFEIGKEGVGYLLSESHLGGLGGSPVFQASVCNGGFGGGTYAAGVIYVSCRDGMHALAFSAQANSFSPLPGWTIDGGAIGPPIVAGGLVWSTGWGDNVLRGLDPATGNAAFRANLGGFDHFASPSAGGGKLFVANLNRVTAFTIASPPPPSGTSTALGTSANPTPAGHAVTLTAAVSPSPDAGTVAFSDGPSAIPGCAGVAVSAATGQASCKATFASGGRHSITAAYSGDAYYGSSTSSALTQVVGTPSAPRPPATTPSLSRIKLAVSGRILRLTLTLSERARLSAVVAQHVRGRRIHGRCVRRAKRGRRCTLTVKRAGRTFAAARGRHTFRLNLTRLRAGRYVIVLSARSGSGGRSRVHRLPFALRPRRRA